jgi:hypothetical protein
MKERRILVLTLAPLAGLAGSWLGLLLTAFGVEGLLDAGPLFLTPLGLTFTGAAYLLACVTTLPLIEPRHPPLHGGKAVVAHGLVYLALGCALGAALGALLSR